VGLEARGCPAQLHNNTSPDDVVICEALLAYIDANLDIAAYWDTLLVRHTGCQHEHT